MNRDVVALILAFAAAQKRADFFGTRAVSFTWCEAHAAVVQRRWVVSHAATVRRVWADGLARALFAGSVTDALVWATRDVALFPPISALAFAAQGGGVELLNRLTDPPFGLSRKHAVQCNALRIAVTFGQVAAVDRLAEAPYSLCAEDVKPIADFCVTCSAADGNFGVLERLGCAPYFLGTAAAPVSVAAATSAARTAIVSGCAEALAWLGRAVPGGIGTMSPPFFNELCHMAKAGWVGVLDQLGTGPYAALGRAVCDSDFMVLRVASAHGHVGILDRLALPPFALGQDAARARDGEALFRAAREGHAPVVDRLARPPYSLGRYDAMRRHLLAAAAHAGQVAVVDRLAMPPYSMGSDNARDQVVSALVEACSCGHVAVLDRLALPPYSMCGDDARRGGGECLFKACAYNRAAVVDRLARPPYSLGNDDVRQCDHRVLRVARELGHVGVVALPPYAPASIDDAR